MASDRIDRTMEELSATVPERDVEPAEVVLRVLLLGRRLEQRIGETLAPQGLQVWEFDVLAALRRQGAPYRLACSELARQVVITCSGMTHRVSRLAERGLVSRCRDEADRRAVYVALTEAGLAQVNTAIERRLGDSTELLAEFDDDEQASLLRLLRRLSDVAGDE